MPIAISDSDASSSLQPSGRPESFPALKHFRVPNIPPAAYYIPDFITPEEEVYILRKLSETPQPKWKTVASGRRLQYWGGTMSKKGTLLPEPLPDWLTQFPNIIQRIESFLDIASGDDFTGKGKALGINQVLINEYQPGQGISPHEDGGAFRPLVATLSLGSHTVLDIHHYLSATSPSPPMITSPSASSDDNGAKPIAAITLAHLLLMPRSLLILSSSLYTSHLHGIAPRVRDVVRADLPLPPSQAETAENNVDSEGVQIANTDQLGDATVVDQLREGSWTADRGTRTSLTFRQAEKVLKGGAFAMAHGALRRT